MGGERKDLVNKMMEKRLKYIIAEIFVIEEFKPVGAYQGFTTLPCCENSGIPVKEKLDSSTTIPAG